MEWLKLIVAFCFGTWFGIGITSMCVVGAMADDAEQETEDNNGSDEE